MATILETEVEQAALAWLEAIGWGVAHGPDIKNEGLTTSARRPDHCASLRGTSPANSRRLS